MSDKPTFLELSSRAPLDLQPSPWRIVVALLAISLPDAGMFVASEENAQPRESGERLHEAIRAGDLTKVKQIIGQSPQLVNQPGRYSFRALNWAAAEDQIEIARFLLKCKANVNLFTKDNRAPPIFDARSAEMVRLLIKHGATLDLKHHRDDQTPLQFAAREDRFEVVQALMEAGAPLDFDSAVQLGWTKHVARMLKEKPWLAKLPRKPLHEAAWDGNRELAKLLLKYGADPNVDYEFSNVIGPYTPLTASVTRGDFEISKLLLDHGADPNVSGGRNHDNLFFFAVAYLDLRFLRAMLQAGADVHATTNWGENVRPLHVAAALGGGRMAAHVQRVGQPVSPDSSEQIAVAKTKLLLESGADPNTTTKDGASPLLFAVIAGNLKVCDLLLAHGARLDFHSACALKKRAEVNQMLKANPQLATTVSRSLKRSALHFAAQGGDRAIVLRLLRGSATPNVGAPMLRFEDASGFSADMDSAGETPLHVAAMFGHADVVGVLSAAGAKFDVTTREYRNKRGPTPLELAVYYGRHEVVKELFKQGAIVETGEDLPLYDALPDARMVKLLLDAAPQIDPQSPFVAELLAESVERGWDETTRLFLDRGVKLDIFSASILGEVDVVRKLLKRNPALVTKVSSRHQPHAIVLAVQKGHLPVVRLLLDYGAPIEEAQLNNKSLLHEAAHYGHRDVLELLLQQGLKLAPQENGKTLLHSAAAGARPKMVAYLLSKSLNPRATDSRQRTPLHALADKWDERPGPEERGRRAAGARVLIKAGADVNAPDKNGRTPLHNAAAGGLTGLAEVLLDAGAKVNARTKQNQTPLACAQGFRNISRARNPQPVIDLLRLRGGTK